MRILTLCGALILVLAASSPVLADPDPHAETDAATRLAARLDRYARQVLERGGAQPSLDAIDLATLPSQFAIELDPDNPEVWRTRLAIAELGEDEVAMEACLQRLSDLDPADDVVRLRRLNLALQRCDTVEELLRSYDRLLSSATADSLGVAVASRLQYDRARVLFRLGETEAYGEALAEAVATDPSNRRAAAEAAGFFRANVNDPLAEAELLTTVILSDPGGRNGQAMLARLLLEHGAYRGAAKMYGLIKDSYEHGLKPEAAVQAVPVDLLVPDNLLADYTLALWGAGDVRSVLDVLNHRQRLISTVREQQITRERPDLTPEEVSEAAVALLAPASAMVRAAMADRLDERYRPQARAAALSAFASYETYARTLGKPDEEVNDAQLAVLVESAWAAIWLGGNVDGVRAVLANVHKRRPLRPERLERFEGWFALRDGNVDRAIELLTPHIDSDPQARLGLAIAFLEQGRSRDGARELLTLSREQPGTVVGVWARSRLEEVLGAPIPPSELAQQLNALVDSIPPSYFRLPDDPTLAVELRVHARQRIFSGYEPVIVDVVVINRSTHPLEIDPNGPIHPLVILEVTPRISEAPNVQRLKPVIVDIGRRLRLAPGERLAIAVDLRRSGLGDVLERYRLRGATLRVHGTVNFRTAGPMDQQAILPRLLGSKVDTGIFRVDGVRATRGWVEDALGAIAEPDAPEDLEALASLMHIVTVAASLRQDPEWATTLEGFEQQILDAFNKLDARSQAWMLTVMPKGVATAPVVRAATQSSDPGIRFAYLLYCLNSPEDPMIASALRDPNRNVQQAAVLLQRLFTRARELELSQQESSP